MLNFDYDIVIIGGGPGGYVAGSYAAQFGKKTAVIEKGLIGGCCLNVGCIPAKTILEAANRFHHTLGSAAFGINASATFDWSVFMQYCEKVRSDLRNGVHGLLRSRKCEEIIGVASIVDRHTLSISSTRKVDASSDFNDASNERIITAKNIIIATGTKPAIPAKFASMNRVLTSDTFWDLNELPKSMVIVGGGVIGCEIASALSRLGTKITIIEQMLDILPLFGSEATDILKKELDNSGVTILSGTSVTDIQDNEKTSLSITAKCSDGNTENISCDYVLWATGRRPILPDFGKLSLALTDRGFIATNSNYMTSIENIYCIGDANGKAALAHAAINQAMQVVSHICTGNSVNTNPEVPQTVFTYPSIAKLGLDANNISPKASIAIGKVPYASLGYSHASDNEAGYFKVLRDINTDTIVGAEIVGYNAYELIHILAPYINKQITANMFSDVMFAHPTLSEGIKLAVENTYIRSPQA